MQLYEADLNTMLKHLTGRRLTRHSEDHGMHGYQLYDSYKGKSTYNLLITVQVIYDMAQAQWDYIVSIFNDLKGCYD